MKLLSRFSLLLLCIILLLQPIFGQDDSFNITYGENRSAIFAASQNTHRWTLNANTGEMLAVEMYRIGGQFQPVLRLLDISGTVLAESDSEGFTDTATLHYTEGFASDGLYFIEVMADARNSDQTTIPDEYNLMVNTLGQRRASVYEGLPEIPAVTAIPALETGDIQDTIGGIPVYGNVSIGQAAGGGFLLENGSQSVTIPNVRLETGLQSITMLDTGTGLTIANRDGVVAQFFTTEDFALNFNSSQLLYTFAIGKQTITTDFFRIRSLRVNDAGQVIVEFLQTDNAGVESIKTAFFTGNTLDIRRRSQVINTIRLDNDNYINTTLTGWDSIAYLDERLYVFAGTDGRFLLDRVFVDDLRAADDTTQIRLGYPSPEQALNFEIDWTLLRDIELVDEEFVIRASNDFVVREAARTVASVIIENSAVQFERINAENRYRLILPDGTEIETPADVTTDETALPGDDGYIPRGYNNLGEDYLTFCPCDGNTLPEQPVNPANGNFYYDVTDFHIPSYSLTLDFKRSYNSRAGNLTPDYLQSAATTLGGGWRHSYQIDLDITFAPYGQVMLLLPDGTQHVYRATEGNANRFRSRTLLDWTIVREGGLTGTWRAFRDDGLQYYFDRAGRLERISEAPNRSLYIVDMPDDYAAGQFIVDPYGRRLELHMNADGLIERVRDTLLREISYTYDDDAQLIGVAYLSEHENATYSYNNNGQLARFDDVRSPSVREGQISYDNENRVITYREGNDSLNRSFNYRYTENTENPAEPYVTRRSMMVGDKERTDTWVYNTRFLLTVYQLPREDFRYEYSYEEQRDALASIRFPTLTTFTYTLDTWGNLVRYDDPQQQTDHILDYEQAGDLSLLTRIRYPGGAEDTFDYDIPEDTAALREVLKPAAYRQLVSRARTNQTRVDLETRYIYDEMGRVILKMTPGYAGDDFIGTQYEYDAYGYVHAVHQGIPLAAGTSPDEIAPEMSARSLRFVHDPLGQLRAIQDGNGHFYTLNYDNNGRLSALQSPDEAVFRTFAYDAQGRLIEENDRGQTHAITYDALNRPVRVERCGEVPLEDTDEVPPPVRLICQQTEYSYDSADNLLSIRNSQGETRYTYDVLNNLTSVTVNDDVTRYETFVEAGGSNTRRRVTLPSGKVLTYRYNSIGQLFQFQISDDPDDPALTYNIAYTGRGALSTIGFTPRGRNLMTLTYDLPGRLVSVANGNLTTEYSYYRSGDLASVTSPEDRITAYRYDTMGNLRTVIAPDESEHHYTYDNNRNLTNSTDANGNPSTFSYDLLNRVTVARHPDDFVLNYGYDARGNLTAYSLPFDETERATSTFSYDTLDRLLATVDSEGNETSIEYDDDTGQLTNILQPGGNTVLLTYGDDGEIISITQNPGQLQSIYSRDILQRITGITAPSGNTDAYSYTFFDALNRAIAPTGLTDNFTWNRYRLDGFTDAAGRNYLFSYESDAENIRRLIEIRDDTPLNKGNPIGDVAIRLSSRFAYDADANLTTIRNAPNDESSQSTRVNTESFDYDAAGNLSSYTDATGATWQFAYDSAGNRIEQLDPSGNLTRYTYSQSNLITSITHYTDTDFEQVERFAYDVAGNVIRHTDTKGIVSTYGYDKKQQLIAMVINADEDDTRCTDPERCMRFEYNAVGNLVAILQSNGADIRYFYAQDRLSRLDISAGGLREQYRYNYDTAGNLTDVTRLDNQNDDDPENDVTLNLSMNYDTLNRRVRFLNEARNAWGYAYDDADNLLQLNDPTGRTLNYDYDVYNRIEQINYPDGGTAQLRYNSAGYLQSITLPDTDDNLDTDGQRFLYETDRVGRLLAIRHVNSAEDALPIVQYTYDPAGNIVERRDAQDTITRYSYDITGRLTQVISRDGQLRFTYDDALNTMTVNTAADDMTHIYTYDDRGTLLRIDTDDTALSYDYDAAGNLVARHGSDYGSVFYEYDDFKRLTKLSLKLDDDTEYSATLSYDLFNRLRELTRSNGVRSIYTYDEVGRPTSIQHFSADDERLDGFSYQYDAAGNLTRINRITDGQRILYSYDSNQRLVDERWLNAEGEVNFTLLLSYDEAGNRIEEVRDGIQTLYIYDNRNRLIEEQRDVNNVNTDIALGTSLTLAFFGISGVWLFRRRRHPVIIIVTGSLLLVAGFVLAQRDSGVSRVLYTYDANGNLNTITYEIPETSADDTDDAEDNFTTHVLNLGYDAEHRLVAITGENESGQAVNIKYGYDIVTGTLQTWENGNDIEYAFLYDGNLPLGLQNADSRKAARYLHLTPHERLLTIDENGDILWHLNDYAGTTRRVTDDTGALLTENNIQNDFRAFGSPVSQINSEHPVTQFAGQWYDTVTGYYLMGLRAYDPRYGRFIQPDPIYQDIPDSLYVYARNRPTMLFDPSGTVPELFLEPLEAYLLPQQLQPENRLPQPFNASVPEMDMVALQNEAFFRAWQLRLASTYGVNARSGALSPVLHDFYVAGFNNIPDDVQTWMTAPIRERMALYNEGSWLTDRTPMPETNPAAFAILDEVLPLLTETTVTPLVFFEEQTLPYNQILPEIPVADPVQDNWQIAATLEGLLIPVPISAALPVEIARLEQVTDILYPNIPVPMVDVPAPVIAPVLTDELEAIREQQQAFLGQRFTPTIQHPSR